LKEAKKWVRDETGWSGNPWTSVPKR
jgi:hypothetical protein